MIASVVASTVRLTTGGLPSMPPGPCTNTAAGPCWGEQCGQARTFLGPADQGCGHSSRQTV
jgi:hypothetical protein